ncbi:MAG: hypothetical protein AAGB93_20065 [Planctomycetota bacterium]
MSLRAPLALLTALSVAAATTPLSAAQDVRVTFSGTVGSIGGGGVGTAPFAGVAVGESVTLVADVQLANALPFGRALGLLNWPTSSLTIGAVSDGLAPTPNLQQVSLGDNTVQFGDYVSVSAFLATDSTTQMQILLSDPSSQTWASDQWDDLVGTTVPAFGLISVFQIWSPQGFVDFELTTVQFEAAPGGSIGTRYCTAEPNSAGDIGVVSAFGLNTAADNDFTLVASNLPSGAVGYFLVSANQGFVANAGGSSGNLCLSGAIGRFVGPGQVKARDFAGEIALPIDLTALPAPTGAVSVQAGETWNFQLWHRDQGPMGATSNFTRALSTSFQ